jgi:integrase
MLFPADAATVAYPTARAVPTSLLEEAHAGTACATFKVPKQIERPVTAVKGLFVVEYPSGRRTYLFRFRNPLTGRKNCIAVGDDRVPFLEIAVMVAALQQKVAQGLDPRPARLTLGEWFDRYFLPHIKTRLRSWRTHVSRFDTHLRPALGERPVNLITGPELVALIDGLQPSTKSRRKITTLSNGATNRVTALVKVIFSTLYAWGVIDKNPAAMLRCRREQNQRARVIRAEEMSAFMSALLELPEVVRLLLILMLLTGMRIGEARRARWSALDTATRTLHLPLTKSGRPRIVPLSPEALQVCEALRRFRRNDWMFPGAGDGPMSPPAKHFKKLVHLAGTDGLWMHDLRRSFSTIACERGAAIQDVSRLIGHADVKTPERYVVSQSQRLHDAASGVGCYLRGALAPLLHASTSSAT